MKKIPQKKLNQIFAWKKQKEELRQECSNTIIMLEKVYDIKENHYDMEYENWTDNDHEFELERSIKHAEFDRKCQIIDAKLAACFLIATNIARRGKLLHPEVAKKKLQKYGKDGQTTANMIEQLYMPQINAMPYLSHELYRSYHVTLMDKNMYNYCLKMIDSYARQGIYGKEKLQHYENFAKKFHKKHILQTRLLQQKLNEKAF